MTIASGQEMREYDRAFIISTIKRLIPGVHVEYTLDDTASVRQKYMKADGPQRAGHFREGDMIWLWAEVEDGKSYVFKLSRSLVKFSSRERRMVAFIPDVLEHILPSSGLPEAQQMRRLSGRLVLGSAIVGKFLHNKKGKGFWQPSFLISQLQELSSQNYEGANATSGFIVVPKPNILENDEIKENYQINYFTNGVFLREGFFDDPISYRYVDGRNAFYLINRQSLVFGIARIKKPLDWSLSNRVFGNHLKVILNQASTSHAWAATVGNKRDIQIFTREGPEIRWNQSFWQFVHLNILLKIFEDSGIESQTCERLVRLVFCLSVMRTGSLILIPNSSHRPKYISAIDSSEVQAKIFATIRGMEVSEFIDGAGLFGLFGSDGLIVISKDGVIEDAGKIVALEELPDKISGGGRTQAAIACSRYGLAIKVSEDGPISFFKDTRLLLKTNG